MSVGSRLFDSLDFCTAQHSAIGLYEALGFVRVGERSVGQTHCPKLNSLVDFRVFNYMLDLRGAELRIETPPDESAPVPLAATVLSPDARRRVVDYARVQETTRPAKAVMAAQVRALLRSGRAMCASLVPLTSTAVARSPSQQTTDSIPLVPSDAVAPSTPASMPALALVAELDALVGAERHLEASERALTQTKTAFERAVRTAQGEVSAKLATLAFVNALFERERS